MAEIVKKLRCKLSFRPSLTEGITRVRARLAVFRKKTWLEIEDIMAAKHAHKRQITEFKYGGCIRLSVGKF